MFVFFGIVFQATGVLESLQLALAVSAPAPAKPSVKIGEALKDISFERAEPATWPTSKLTDELRDAVDSLKKKGIAKPFVFIDIIKKPLASWALVGTAKEPLEGACCLYFNFFVAARVMWFRRKFGRFCEVLHGLRMGRKFSPHGASLGGCGSVDADERFGSPRQLSPLGRRSWRP